MREEEKKLEVDESDWKSVEDDDMESLFKEDLHWDWAVSEWRPSQNSPEKL